MRGGTEPSPKSSRPSSSPAAPHPLTRRCEGVHTQVPPPSVLALTTRLDSQALVLESQKGLEGSPIEGLLLILRLLRKGLSGGTFLQPKGLGPLGKVTTETGGKYHRETQ